MVPPLSPRNQANHGFIARQDANDKDFQLSSFLHQGMDYRTQVEQAYPDKSNIPATACSLLLGEMEDLCLRILMDTAQAAGYSVGGLIYDGLHVSRRHIPGKETETSIEQVLRIAEKDILGKHGWVVRFDEKAWSDPFAEACTDGEDGLFLYPPAYVHQVRELQAFPCAHFEAFLRHVAVFQVAVAQQCVHSHAAAALWARCLPLVGLFDSSSLAGRMASEV